MTRLQDLEAQTLARENRRLEKEKRRLENREAYRKSLVPAKKPIKTPEGSRERMQMFKERLLKARTGEGVIKKVIQIANDDNHPGQTAALKMCMDRMLPTSLFEEQKDGTGITVIIQRYDNEGGGVIIEGVK